MNHSVAEDNMRDRALLYALGTLTLSEARAFEDHLAEGCDDCAVELCAAEQLATNLSFETAAIEPPPRVLDRLLEFAAVAKPSAPANQNGSTRPLTTVWKDEGDWFESSPGVMVKRLYENHQTGTITSLIRMQPGAYGTVHRHPGVEECIVIEGDFHVGGGSLGPGDYHVAAAGSIHEKPFSIGGALLLILGPPYERL